MTTITLYLQPDTLRYFTEPHDEDVELEVSFVQNDRFRLMLNVELSSGRFEFKSYGDPARILLPGSAQRAKELAAFVARAEARARAKGKSSADQE